MPVFFKRIGTVWLGYLVAFVVLSGFYMALAATLPLNSDSTSAVLEAQDILRGNALLHGWDLSAESYDVTETLPFVIVAGLAGWHLSFYYLVPALLMAAMVLLAFRLCRILAPEGAWCWLALVAAPTAFGVQVMLIPCIHVGAYVGVLLCWLLIFAQSKGERLALWAAFVVLMVLCLASDDIIKYCFVFPVLGAASLLSAQKRRLEHGRLVLCLLVSMGLVHVLKTVLAHNGAFHVPGLWTMSFAGQERIGYNLSVLVSGILHFFGAYFFSKEFSLHGSGKELAHLAVFLLALWGVIRIVRSKTVRLDLFDYAALLCMGLMVAAFTVSQLAIDDASTRYLVFPYVMMALLLARHTRLSQAGRTLGLAGAVVYAVLSVPMPTVQIWQTNRNFPINMELARLGLRQGFAPYWAAAANSLPNPVRIAPVEFGADITPFHYLSKRDWYTQGGNFFLCKTPAQAAQLQARFGPARKVEAIDGHILLVWDKIITLPG
ncbi:hypothetical protein [Acetobacter orleanensis]|uniref:Glycosyltransferase RgtA/B/C/D-like domain-containing protein n=1 Tax=Acetobacter orleanensis TaxID=104099 RepID=A0A4Y3TM58_9PROT|nr:hypothetical protein [Acetobacter orleanensis]KXV62596.1 hypothetical protein AD949_10875 [Acetobacter orleanensis]PCD79955.1 hypothetical protein CO710_03590 [Acetobacter orleanensis]GAN68263.1 hypothetical protein Abol_015_102 [Acetobacter orleanensis JCM 7639]GBR31206.1 hypothetical protein AA0473_2477 [Acetobacter orleanensis NRIC 0473]GEB82844.1 hypothetical protein AOR01nite_13210 [Acetobacter orleanensis]